MDDNASVHFPPLKLKKDKMERFGPEALQPKRRNRNWTPDDKREISLIQRRGWKGCGKHHKSGFSCNYTVEEYIHYYNNERIQKKTKWMPPVKFQEASMCA